MTATHANPLIVTENRSGYERSYLDLPRLASLIAAEWGAELGECEAGSYGIGRVVIGDLVVTLRSGKVLGRVEVYAGAPSITRRTGSLYGVEWPSATADTAKGVEKLAADLKRRVVDKSGEALKAAREKLTAYTKHHSDMKAAAKRFAADNPGAVMTIPDDVTKWEARFRIHEGKRYITGHIGSSGGITLDSWPSIPADKAAAVFALLYGEA